MFKFCGFFKASLCAETRNRVANSTRTSGVVKTLFMLLVACMYGLPSFADEADDENKQFDTTDANGVTWRCTISKKDGNAGVFQCVLDQVFNTPDNGTLTVPSTFTEPESKITYNVVNFSQGCFAGTTSQIYDLQNCGAVRTIIPHASFNGCANLKKIILPSEFNIPTNVGWYTSIGAATYICGEPGFEGFCVGGAEAGFAANKGAKITNNTPNNINTLGVHSGMLFSLEGNKAYLLHIPKARLLEGGPAIDEAIWDQATKHFTMTPTISFDGQDYVFAGYKEYAFDRSNDIEILTINASVTGDLPGVEKSMKYIEVTEGNPRYKGVDGVVYSLQEDSIFIFPSKKVLADSTYRASSSLRYIDAACFHNVESLKTLDIVECPYLDELPGGCLFDSNNIKELRCSKYIKKIATGITYRTGVENIFLQEPTNKPDNLSVRYWSGTNPGDTDTYGILYTADKDNPSAMGDSLVEFPHAKSLDTYSVPVGITYVYDGACRYGHAYAPHKITHLRLPASLKTIGGNAFSVGSIISVEFYGGVPELEEIKAEAFNSCSFSSFSLPQSVKTIGDAAFCSNTALSSFIFPENASLTTLGANVFNGCTSLAVLDMKNCVNLTNIPTHAFRRTSITDLTFPVNLTTINANAFNDDDDVTLNQTSTMNITFSGTGLKTIEQKAFKGCLNLHNIDFSKQDSLKKIGDYAFMGSGLEKVSIPKTVKSMGHHAFMACPKIQAIDVDGENPVYISVKGVLYSKKTVNGELRLKKLLAYPGGRSSDSYDFQTAADGGKNCYTIIPSVEEIGDSAFYGCEKLEDLKLPANLKKIGNWAFRCCSRLTNISIMSKKAPELNWTTPANPNEDPTIDLFRADESQLANNIKPVLIVRKGADYSKGWDAFDKYVSFDEPTTHAEYFPWSESREAAANGAKPNNVVMDGDASIAKAGQFDLNDKKANDETFGFSKIVNYTDSTGRPTTVTWYYDKVAAMGIQDEAERKLAQTFIIPAKVQGNFDGTNRNYQVTAVGDSAFCRANAPFLKDITMQGDPEYLATNSFGGEGLLWVYFPNHIGVNMPVSSMSFKSEDSDYSNGDEFAHPCRVHIRKTAFDNGCQIRHAAHTLANADVISVTYKMAVDVNKVEGQPYKAGTICHEFDVDFSDCNDKVQSVNNNLLLFWVMKSFNRKPTDQIDGVDHYWNAWSFPSNQKYMLKAGDGAIVRVPESAHDADVYCTFYEGDAKLKTISEFDNPEDSSEEGVITGGKAPNALVGVYARTYLKNGDAHGAKAYTPFKVNCDGTPSGKTADVEAGYIMGWNRSSANGGGKFVLANAKEADTDSPSGQFTPFRAFLATEYQTLPTDQNGNPAKFFMMAWDGDTSTATDIRGIVNVVDGDTYYNINGQRVEKPTAKGLYIHNGKKVLVK